MTTEFWNKLLPNQPEHTRLSPSPRNTLRYEAILYDLLGSFHGASTNYTDLNLALPENMTIPEMASNPVLVAFLQFLITMHRPKCVIEIGSFVGISALKMAAVMPYGSRLYTIEKGEEFAELAKTNLARFRGTVDITLFHKDALALIRVWAAEGVPIADFVFLDGDKEHYEEYLEPLAVIMRPGALLVVDDAFFHGDVLNPVPTTDKGWGVKRLLERAAGMPWSKVLLPLGNGVLLLQKPGL